MTLAGPNGIPPASSSSAVSAEATLAALGETGAVDAIAHGWPESMATFIPEALDFLQPAAWQEYRAWCNVERTWDRGLGVVAERILNSQPLSRLAWHYVRRMYEDDHRTFPPPPSLVSSLGPDSGLFFVLIALAWVPRLRAWHRTLGIPEEVTRETCLQVRCFMDNYVRAHSGRPGLFIGQLAWLWHYLKNKYVRRGRFEYWAMCFDGEVEVYRNVQTGATVALAAQDWLVDKNGYRVASPADAPDVWQTSIDGRSGAATGFPVSPRGRVCRQPAVLPHESWRRVLAKGDPVLDMHIPGGGGMPPEATRSSLQSGVEFFRRTFPDEAPAAIVCTSWMFSPQLEEALPPEANLVRLLGEVYLYPNPGLDRNLWFVFLQDRLDPATAPRETSLQRALLAFLAGGKTWRMGSMFLLADDVAHLGKQTYRKQFPFSL